uniref:Helicase/UvrB N-terminal domain-containing protein n=1 Tax=Pithovirus LCPAC102 TaxID=2506587 RepID=A0A481Z433_9VIRU|nr:MAG: uncharacterized protein LCPAC102_01270 [Pithovirus LCPAC102]
MYNIEPSSKTSLSLENLIYTNKNIENNILNPSILSSLTLDNLVYSYPDQNDTEFQTKITAKKEFNTLASIPSESVPKRGEFYNHQKFDHRFLHIYDRLLITSSPGTGKTGSVAGESEKLRRSTMGHITDYVDDYIHQNKTHIKRVYYLVKSKTLKDQIKKELLCKYSKPGTYETEKILKNKSAQARKLNITIEIKKYYSIDTHIKFAKRIYERKYTDEDIEKEFSGSMFIYDEVHNIRIEHRESEEDNGIDESILINRQDKDVRQQKKIYDTYKRIFHIIKRSKVVLMTATPMINEASEISIIMNLILSMDKQMPTDNKFFVDATHEDLAYYFNGLISFVGESDTFAIPLEHGTISDSIHIYKGFNIPSSQKIYRLEMASNIIMPDKSSIHGQATIYNSISLLNTRNNSFRGNERSAANFVFPNGTYSMSGVIKYDDTRISGTYGLPQIGKYIIDNGNEVYTPVPEFISWITNPYYLKSISVKFHEVIRLDAKSPGNAFVFCPFKMGGGGALCLGMCFKYNGYEQFNETESVFISTHSDESSIFMGPLCELSNNTNTEGVIRTIRRNKIRSTFTKARRFAIITSGMQPSNKMDIILELYNSWENRHGEYIKTLIVTPIAREGINTANVLSYYNTGPEWNEAHAYQARYRVLRAISHESLLDELREQYILEGKDPATAKIYVNMYNMAAIDPVTRGSIDIDMYHLSEKKDISIKYIENIMYSSAVDCQIHYERNKISRATTAYANEFGGYVCYGKTPIELDTSSYDVLYADDDIKLIIQYIHEIFKNIFSASMDEILDLLSNYQLVNKFNNTLEQIPRRYIERAMEIIISKKILMVDRYGYHGYIRVKGQQFYIIREYPTISENENNSIEDYYSFNLFGILTKPISEYIIDLKQSSSIKIEKMLYKLEPGNNEWSNIYNKLSYEYKIKLYEDSIIDMIKGNNTNLNSHMYNMYKKDLNIIYEPIKLLNLVQYNINNRGGGRGRPPKLGNIPILSQLKINENDIQIPILGDIGVGTELIYIHSINKNINDISSYSISSNIEKSSVHLRIYKPSELKGWRDMLLNEHLVYTSIIDKIINSKLIELNKLPLYGIISSTGNDFRIRYMMKEQSGASKRKRMRGRVVKTYDIKDLAFFMWIIQAPLPIENMSNALNIHKSYKVQYLHNLNYDINTLNDPINKYENDRIDYYYVLFNLNYMKLKMAELIKNRLIELGWIYIN